MREYFPLMLIELVLCAGGLIMIYRLSLAEKIYRSKRHLDSAFDSIEDPLAIINRDYTVVRVNKAYSDLVEKPFPRILNRKCYAVLRGRETPCDDCKIQEVFHTQRKWYIPNAAYPLTSHNRTISITFYPFRPKKGSEYSVVEHIRDITELEYLKDNLEKRNKVLSDTTIILRQAQAEMDDELELARQVQRSSLPHKPPVIDGLKIAATYHPIKAVGGDIYDFIPFSKNKLAIFVGDASGHGLPSAFISTMSKMLVYNNTREEIAPAVLLDRINRDLLSSVRTTYYLTAICAVFDLAENSILYSRAGHPKPIVIRADGQVFHLNAYGTFIGILDDAVYEQKKFFLRKGDRCYFCTDGIYEVMAAPQRGADSILGFKRFTDIVASVNHLPFDEVIPAIEQKLSPFVYEDDYTLIMAEVTADRPVDIRESLPGFVVDDEMGFLSFSDYSQIARQLESIATAMKKKSYPAADIQHMQLCINELVANALEHGNRNDPGLHVTLAYTVDDRAVKLCIVDEGNGFSLEVQPDPTDDAHIAKEGGRGLYLVRHYVDRIGQNSRGNGIYLIKNKGGRAS